MDKTITAASIIRHLNLVPHPEGGFFRETYRSEGIIPVDSMKAGFSGDRNYSTAIYFLLTADNFSAFHRVRQDEFWHFHQGSPIELHMLTEDGNHSSVQISNALEMGHIPQFVVPGGNWFAAEVRGKDNFALVSCTVSPGFDFDDFELATRAGLIADYPEHSELITRFTRA